MEITIENNELVYIYLMDVENRVGIVDDTIPFVMGDLLYDAGGYWIGLRLKDQFHEYGHCKFVDEFAHKIEIQVNEDTVEAFFDSGHTQVARTRRQDFNIDISGGKIYGIEILVDSDNSIANKRIPKEMIKREV
jgi:hypothetical protein